MADAAEDEEPKPTGRWLWKDRRDVRDARGIDVGPSCASLIGGQRWARQCVNKHLKTKKEA